MNANFFSEIFFLKTFCCFCFNSKLNFLLNDSLFIVGVESNFCSVDNILSEDIYRPMANTYKVSTFAIYIGIVVNISNLLVSTAVVIYARRGFLFYWPQGSSCGSVGIAVASNIRGPQFESSYHQNIIMSIYFANYWKEENKENRGRECHIFKTFTNLLLALWSSLGID